MDEACDDDDVLPSLEAPGVVLTRDTGCVRRLQWSCRFVGRTAREVAEGLRASGLPDESRLPGLADFALPGRHHLVIVPATERVQLRLDVSVAREERAAEALRVARWIVARLDTANP